MGTIVFLHKKRDEEDESQNASGVGVTIVKSEG